MCFISLSLSPLSVSLIFFHVTLNNDISNTFCSLCLCLTHHYLQEIDYKKNRPGKSKAYDRQYSSSESEGEAEDQDDDDSDDDGSFRAPTTGQIAKAKSAREDSVKYN
jgi:hypothetical protein